METTHGFLPFLRQDDYMGEWRGDCPVCGYDKKACAIRIKRSQIVDIYGRPRRKELAPSVSGSPACRWSGRRVRHTSRVAASNIW
jgi:hypothetical protein